MLLDLLWQVADVQSLVGGDVHRAAALRGRWWGAVSRAAVWGGRWRAAGASNVCGWSRWRQGSVRRRHQGAMAMPACVAPGFSEPPRLPPSFPLRPWRCQRQTWCVDRPAAAQEPGTPAIAAAWPAQAPAGGAAALAALQAAPWTGRGIRQGPGRQCPPCSGPPPHCLPPPPPCAGTQGQEGGGGAVRRQEGGGPRQARQPAL